MNLIERVSEKECRARYRDTGESDVGNSAGHVNAFCQSLDFDDDLRQNVSGQFDQTVLNFHCGRPIHEPNADAAEGGVFCRLEESGMLPKRNSGTSKLAPVDNTATPDKSFYGNKSGWRRGRRARLVRERHHQLIQDGGRERQRSLPDTGEGVVDDTWKMPKEAGIRLSPCWRRKLSDNLLRSSTSESGTSCCAESDSQRTRLRQTTSTTSTMTRTATRASCTTCEHCIESAYSSSHFDVGSHAPSGSSSESRHVIHVHVRLSLSSPLSLSTSICPSPSSPTSSFSCTRAAH